jgi:hypothetical protein
MFLMGFYSSEMRKPFIVYFRDEQFSRVGQDQHFDSNICIKQPVMLFSLPSNPLRNCFSSTFLMSFLKALSRCVVVIHFLFTEKTFSGI